MMASNRQHSTRALANLSEDAVDVAPLPGLLDRSRVVPAELLDGGETVILALKPSMWYLVLVSARWLLGAALVVLLGPWLVRVYPAISHLALTQIAVIVTAVRLVLALVQWSSRLYVLTNRRVMCYRGVTRICLFEAPLVRIRNTYIKARPVERLCNVGSIGFSLEGEKKVDGWWEQVGEPHDVHKRIRRAIERALDNHVPY